MKQKLTNSILKKLIKEEKAKLLKESGVNQQMYYKMVENIKKYVINNNKPEDAAMIMLQMIQEAAADVDGGAGNYWGKFFNRFRNG